MKLSECVYEISGLSCIVFGYVWLIRSENIEYFILSNNVFLRQIKHFSILICSKKMAQMFETFKW